MSYWTVPPEWAGETAFILGCGPSLANARDYLWRLKNYGRVIAINDSFILTPDADVLYFCDQRFYNRHRNLINVQFHGRYIVTLENQISGIRTLKNTGEIGLESDPGGLRTGSNSGYQCINLAYHFGASKIVLIGFDMHTSNGRMHWNGRSDRQNPVAFQKTIEYHMLPKFQFLKEPLEKAKVEVINATPGSALTIWPIVPIHDVLNPNGRR